MDMSSYVIAEPMLKEHCYEYTVVIGLQIGNPPMVYGTENMTEREILLFLKAHATELRPEAQYKLYHSDLRDSAEFNGVVFKRYPKCWICNETSPCHVLERFNS